jgi:hypothetical protein
MTFSVGVFVYKNIRPTGVEMAIPGGILISM